MIPAAGTFNNYNFLLKQHNFTIIFAQGYLDTVLLTTPETV